MKGRIIIHKQHVRQPQCHQMEAEEIYVLVVMESFLCFLVSKSLNKKKSLSKPYEPYEPYGTFTQLKDLSRNPKVVVLNMTLLHNRCTDNVK